MSTNRTTQGLTVTTEAKKTAFKHLHADGDVEIIFVGVPPLLLNLDGDAHQAYSRSVLEDLTIALPKTWDLSRDTGNLAVFEKIVESQPYSGRPEARNVHSWNQDAYWTLFHATETNEWFLGPSLSAIDEDGSASLEDSTHMARFEGRAAAAAAMADLLRHLAAEVPETLPWKTGITASA